MQCPIRPASPASPASPVSHAWCALPWLVAAAVAAAAPTAAPRKLPAFEDFREPVRATPARVEPKLRTAADRTYRTRVRAAAGGKPNFGGHYVLETFGCGTQCQSAFTVDKSTGDVAWLPDTYLCPGVEEPFEFRADSRLVVVRGSTGPCETRGTTYYALQGTTFTEIARVEATPP